MLSLGADQLVAGVALAAHAEAGSLALCALDTRMQQRLAGHLF